MTLYFILKSLALTNRLLPNGPAISAAKFVFVERPESTQSEDAEKDEMAHTKIYHRRLYRKLIVELPPLLRPKPHAFHAQHHLKRDDDVDRICSTSPIFFGFPLHRWRRRIFDFHPTIGATRSIGRTEPLRDDALAAELAGVLEHSIAGALVIDGEAIVTDDKGLAVFDLVRRARNGGAAVLCTFDLIELDGEDLRRLPIEARKGKLAKLVRTPHPGIVVNEHYGTSGPATPLPLPPQAETLP